MAAVMAKVFPLNFPYLKMVTILVAILPVLESDGRHSFTSFPSFMIRTPTILSLLATDGRHIDAYSRAVFSFDADATGSQTKFVLLTS